MDISQSLESGQQKLFIAGSWRDAVSGARFDTRDPARDEVIANVARGGERDIDAAVTAARSALPEWMAITPARRAGWLRTLAAAVAAGSDTLTRIEVLDAGKPVTLARQEVASCVDYLYYYAGAADKIQGETVPLGDGYLDYTLHEPLGVTAHITPWNAPLGMICRSLAPALASGNTAVVKPAEQAPLGALKLAQVFAQAGLPPGVLNVVTGLGCEAGAALAGHPDIDSLTFTGSVATGRQVLHATADHVVPTVVELGGKSPQIVFADADLDRAARETVKGIFSNSGQYCDAGSRLLVHHSMAASFSERVADIGRKLTTGPGLENPDLGPLASREHFERVSQYLSLAAREGARALLGGKPLPKPGYFVPPTIFADVTPAMRIYREEIFGPVLTVTEFADDTEALALANDCDYGLAAGLYTRDFDRALDFAARIEAGYVMVNEYFAGGVGAPFGGRKLSGYGRERGLAALQNYTRVKNVVIRWRSSSTGESSDHR